MQLGVLDVARDLRDQAHRVRHVLGAEDVLDLDDDLRETCRAAQRHDDLGSDVHPATDCRGIRDEPQGEQRYAGMVERIAQARRVGDIEGDKRVELPQLTTASSVTVRLNEPGSLYLPRINNIDLSLRNTIQIGKKKLRPAIEAFNILNANPETSVLDSYPIVGRPQVLLPGRLVRFQVSYEW